jgi:hypothetical protein
MSVCEWFRFRGSASTRGILSLPLSFFGKGGQIVESLESCDGKSIRRDSGWNANLVTAHHVLCLSR